MLPRTITSTTLTNNLLADLNVPEIAYITCHGLVELINIVPIEMCKEVQSIWAVFLELRDAWFEIKEGGEYTIKPFS